MVMNVILWVVAALFIAVGAAPLLLKRIFNEGSAAAMCFGAAAALCAVLRQYAANGSSGAHTAAEAAAWVLVALLCVAFAAGLALSFAMVATIVKSEGEVKAKSHLSGRANRQDTILILGCRLYGSTPTRALKGRVDRGLKLLTADESLIAIVSGGKGSDEQTSEAAAMADYLENSGGILCSRIIMEDKSCSTEENLKFSMPLFLKNCMERRKLPGRITVVSDGFHLLRAKLLAKKQGVGNVFCAAAFTPSVDFPVHWIRELLALARLLVLGR